MMGRNMSKLKIVVVGLGKQSIKDHIPAILRRDDAEIVSVVDIDSNRSKEVGNSLGVGYFTDAKEAITTTNPDAAVVCVPHHAYLEVLELLAKNQIATLKEKPLALNAAEANYITNLYKSNDAYLQVCVQRRFSKLYDTTKQLMGEIGTVYSVYIEYTLNLTAEDMVSGWRADKKYSGGGATIDMGYHIIDLLTYLFGVPERLYAQLNYNSIGDGYTIDDTMKALMTFDKTINANIVITKIFNQKNEKIRIFGDRGSVSLDGRNVTLFDNNKNEMEAYTFNSKDEEVDRQLDFFIKNHRTKQTDDSFLKDQLSNTVIIDSIYKSHAEKMVIAPGEVVI